MQDGDPLVLETRSREKSVLSLWYPKKKDACASQKSEPEVTGTGSDWGRSRVLGNRGPPKKDRGLRENHTGSAMEHVLLVLFDKKWKKVQSPNAPS